jgi:hypothetical protein
LHSSDAHVCFPLHTGATRNNSAAGGLGSGSFLTSLFGGNTATAARNGTATGTTRPTGTTTTPTGGLFSNLLSGLARNGTRSAGGTTGSTTGAGGTTVKPTTTTTSGTALGSNLVKLLTGSAGTTTGTKPATTGAGTTHSSKHGGYDESQYHLAIMSFQAQDLRDAPALAINLIVLLGMAATAACCTARLL